jgi:hypothetical protein
MEADIKVKCSIVWDRNSACRPSWQGDGKQNHDARVSLTKTKTLQVEEALV